MSDCPSSILIHDDHWGGFRDYCELPAGHEGEHRSAREVCDKPAWLVWIDADTAEEATA